VTDAVPALLATELSAPDRLALAYAPRETRGRWTALLALDRRLGRAALHASEPMLGQLRLAWWRDRFRSPASAWPAGEPLLAALAPFDAERGALETLVDAWEALIGGAPEASAVAALSRARAAALLALARVLACDAPPTAVEALAHRWTLGELAPDALDDRVPVPPGLPRAMRPLPILAELAADRGAQGLRERMRGLLRIIRLGMTGR